MVEDTYLPFTPGSYPTPDRLLLPLGGIVGGITLVNFEYLQ